MSIPAILTETTAADIQSLVTDQAKEGQYLDFKRDLPVTWDSSAKHELLADATAFANSGGGDIVFGVDEDENATAREICPQTLSSVDQEVRKLQDFLMNLAEPRMPGIQVQAVEVAVGDTVGHAVVIRIPHSWTSPHRVAGNRNFYVREGLRKRAVDVPELRGLFLRTESQAQRLRNWRSDRLGKILTGETPTPVIDGPKLVIHAVPTEAAMRLVSIDPVPYSRGQTHLPMIGESLGSAATLNFDGAYVSLRGGAPKANVYTQLFRQGYFEAVWVVQPWSIQEPMLPGEAYEKYVIRFLGSVRGELERLGVRYDLAVFISLLGADKVYFAGPGEFGRGSSKFYRFDRRDLLLPEVLISAEVSPGRGMRPAFDLMCQAAGMPGSVNYDEEGEWKASRQ